MPETFSSETWNCSEKIFWRVIEHCKLRRNWNHQTDRIWKSSTSESRGFTHELQTREPNSIFEKKQKSTGRTHTKESVKEAQNLTCAGCEMCRKKNVVARAPAPKDKVNVKSELHGFRMAARPGYRAAAGTDLTCANLSLWASMGPSCMSMGASSSSIPCSRPCFYQSSGSRISPPHPQKSPVINRNIMTTYGWKHIWIYFSFE
jgi:hypothetical protein